VLALIVVGTPSFRAKMLSTAHAGSSSLDVNVSIRVPDPLAPSCAEPNLQGAEPMMAKLNASGLSACLGDVGMAPALCVVAKSVVWGGMTVRNSSEVCPI